MADLYKVVIRNDMDYGYVQYNTETKELEVVLKDEAKREQVKQYLTARQTLMAPQQTLLDFCEHTMVPVDNVDNLKLALTRLWNHTGILVDWSHPIS